MNKCLFLSLFVIAAVAVLFSCDYSKPSADELNDPTRALHIQVTSIPSGASIYAVDGDAKGEYLGVTPMTFKYVYRHTVSGPIIYGTNVDETISRHIDISNLLSPPYSFHCRLAMDGYRDHVVAKALKLPEGTTERNLNTALAFSPRVESVAVEMIPVEEGAAAIPRRKIQS